MSNANGRLTPLSFRCTWCNQIKTGKSWMLERRRTRSGAYVNVICHRCRHYYLHGFDLESFIVWVKEQVG